MTRNYYTTVAITGLNAAENPGPGVSVIRSIRQEVGFKGKIVGLAYDPLDVGAYMQGICDHVYLLPYPSQGSEALLARLETIHYKTPIDVILPTLDAELTAFLAIVENLEQMGIRSLLPREKSLRMCGKPNLSNLLESHGVRTPKGITLKEPWFPEDLGSGIGFPVMVKGQFYGAEVAYSAMEAEKIFRRFLVEWGLPVIVQEYVFGDEYDVLALGDGAGGLVGMVPMRKMRITDKGKAWGGITIEDPAMNDFAEHVISQIKWRGPCELEIIKSQKTSEYYLIEINPRFPAWSYLSTGAGQNIPWACVRLALGEQIEPFAPYDVGVQFLRHSVDMVYPLSLFEQMTTQGELHNAAVQFHC
jgi:carbamoyl-phosphate synthase large subunit